MSIDGYFNELNTCQIKALKSSIIIWIINNQIKGTDILV